MLLFSNTEYSAGWELDALASQEDYDLWKKNDDGKSMPRSLGACVKRYIICALICTENLHIPDTLSHFTVLYVRLLM